jgi:hypothetical protein
MSMFVSMIALALGQGAYAAQPSEVMSEARAAVMTRSEIREYNAKLERSHPAYIRCDRRLETGSLVKKVDTCRTNEEWRRVETVANDDARDIVDRVNASGSSRGIETPVGPAIGG